MSDGALAYRLTEHARDALAKRRIALEWIEQALTDPVRIEADATDPQLEHRLARIEAFGDRVLRVIVNTDAERVRIVTAYFDRRAKLE